ncbi:Cation/H(+) antiporter 7-like protein [Drosera capensis]
MTILFIANSSVSAFINLIPILEGSNLLSKDLAQLATSASAMCESLVWAVWISVTITQQPNIIKCIGSAVLLLALIGFIVLLVRPAMMKIVQTLEGQLLKDCYVVIILIFVLICGMMSNAIAGTALLGTVVLGLETPDGLRLGSALTERIETIWNTCLLPFFLSIGAAADMSSATADWQPLLKLQSIMISGYLAKLLGAMSVSCSTQKESWSFTSIDLWFWESLCRYLFTLD